MAYVGIFTSFVALLVVSTIVRGFILSVLWGWFAVPIFHLPPLSIAAAIGVSIIASLLTHQTSCKDESEGGWARLAGKAAGRTIALPLVVLPIGWLIQRWL